MISLENWLILTPLQKLPRNVGDLGKLIVAKGFKSSQSPINRPIWSHCSYYKDEKKYTNTVWREGERVREQVREKGSFWDQKRRLFTHTQNVYVPNHFEADTHKYSVKKPRLTTRS